MPERFVSEAIVPEAGGFDAVAMATGEPAPPARFCWRGREFTVVEQVESWRELTPRSFESEQYLRRHWFRLRTACGATLVIYFQRRARDAGRGPRWWLYTIEEA
ncbi:cytoplasmic protein [bacterium]|nr:cytoplasmic protein [bacterium]